MRVTMWGVEFESITEAAADPRCPVPLAQVHWRLSEGWSLEEALTMPLSSRPEPIPAWGEVRTAEDWAADPRAAVTAFAIRYRLAAGWSPEDAISKPRRRTGRPRGASASRAERDADLLAALRTGGPTRTRDLAVQLDRSPGMILRDLNRLRDEALVAQVKRSVWTLAPRR